MKRIALDSGLDPYALVAASRDGPPHAIHPRSLTGPRGSRTHVRRLRSGDHHFPNRSGGPAIERAETVKTDRPLEALRSILAKYERRASRAVHRRPGRYSRMSSSAISIRGPPTRLAVSPSFEFGLYLTAIVESIRKRRNTSPRPISS